MEFNEQESIGANKITINIEEIKNKSKENKKKKKKIYTKNILKVLLKKNV